MKIRTAGSLRKQFELIAEPVWVAIRTALLIVRQQRDVIARSTGMAIRTKFSSVGKQPEGAAASIWIGGPASAILAIGIVCWFYVHENYSGEGKPFAWFDGTSAWPSITILLFTALLSAHFIIKIQFDLTRNAGKLAKEFGLRNRHPGKTSYFGWEVAPSKPGTNGREEKIDIATLWERYHCRGQFRRRLFRAAPMTFLYLMALAVVLPLVGDFPVTSLRGGFPFLFLMTPTIMLFLFLTFFVIDAILLHEGFLLQLEKKETYWPDATFKKFEYPIEPQRPGNENDLADYWDILLISKRTEAVGRLIYYPFIILSLLIIARFRCFYNWAWSPVLIVALSMHFSLALYAAWRLPKVARAYRDKVLERLKRRRRQALMFAQRIPEAIDTMIEEVQSTHQGAFSYLWDQPAIRALLLPSSGIGLATLLQFLPH